MLKNIDPVLGPDLLAMLRAMGHGDEIAIVDANYPAAAAGCPLVRLDGLELPRVLDAVLSVLPLDDFVPVAAWHMKVVDGPEDLPIFDEIRDALRRHEPSTARLDGLERDAFYERVKTASVVIATGEGRLYGNVILKKGVIRLDGKS